MQSCSRRVTSQHAHDILPLSVFDHTHRRHRCPDRSRPRPTRPHHRRYRVAPRDPNCIAQLPGSRPDLRDSAARILRDTHGSRYYHDLRLCLGSKVVCSAKREPTPQQAIWRIRRNARRSYRGRMGHDSDGPHTRYLVGCCGDKGFHRTGLGCVAEERENKTMGILAASRNLNSDRRTTGPQNLRC